MTDKLTLIHERNSENRYRMADRLWERLAARVGESRAYDDRLERSMELHEIRMRGINPKGVRGLDR